MRRICIINQKGGVGKTTTAVNLGAGLSRHNRKVLILDLDPQGNIGICFNDTGEKDMYDFLIENADIKECTRNLGLNLDIITSKESLTRAEAMMVSMENKETLLRRKLVNVTSYDYIIIDCPPSIGLLTQNAVLASTEAIIPVSCDYLSYKGLKAIVQLINFMVERYDHDIVVSRILPTLYEPRNSLNAEVLGQMKNDFYELISDPIDICPKLREAPKIGQSIFKFALKSKGARDYGKLVRSVIYEEKEFKLNPQMVIGEPIDDETAERTRKKAKEGPTPKIRTKKRATHVIAKKTSKKSSHIPKKPKIQYPKMQYAGKKQMRAASANRSKVAQSKAKPYKPKRITRRSRNYAKMKYFKKIEGQKKIKIRVLPSREPIVIY